MASVSPRAAARGKPKHDQNWKWYHIVISTYGAWLPGDPRSFRTRDHREHVEGDYKHRPPEGKYEGLHDYCQHLMTDESVKIPSHLRPIVGQAIKQRLEELGAIVIAISVSAMHVHVLAKMPWNKPKAWAGLAKKHAWFVSREHDWTRELWAKGCRPVTVKNRPHQLAAYRYIIRHREQGAWAWSWTGE